MRTVDLDAASGAVGEDGARGGQGEGGVDLDAAARALGEDRAGGRLGDGAADSEDAAAGGGEEALVDVRTGGQFQPLAGRIGDNRAAVGQAERERAHARDRVRGFVHHGVGGEKPAEFGEEVGCVEADAAGARNRRPVGEDQTRRAEHVVRVEHDAAVVDHISPHTKGAARREVELGEGILDVQRGRVLRRGAQLDGVRPGQAKENIVADARHDRRAPVGGVAPQPVNRRSP